LSDATLQGKHRRKKSPRVHDTIGLAVRHLAHNPTLRVWALLLAREGMVACCRLGCQKIMKKISGRRLLIKESDGCWMRVGLLSAFVCYSLLLLSPYCKRQVSSSGTNCRAGVSVAQSSCTWDRAFRSAWHGQEYTPISFPHATPRLFRPLNERNRAVGDIILFESLWVVRLLVCV